MEPTGMYRAGYPFTSVELQSMVHDGALRHMMADVYAEAQLPQTAALRAAAAYALLNSTLRRGGVLCGETAAWVHLGTAPPDRVAVIAQGTALRQVASAGRWQLHQIPVDEEHVETLGPLRTTTALRTAADLFCGFGVRGFRQALDRITAEAPGWSRTEETLQHWPAVKVPLRGRDEDISAIGAEDQQLIQQRWHLIAQLSRRFRLDTDELADTVLRTLSRTSWDARRRDHVRQLLDQCVSRRLPTVR